MDDSDVFGSIVQSAALQSIEGGLRNVLQVWERSSPQVHGLLHWTEHTPKELCEKSRPGAFLSDCMLTEARVRTGGSRRNCQYFVAGNKELLVIAKALGIVTNTNSNSNNVGNLLEALCWVALEEGASIFFFLNFALLHLDNYGIGIPNIVVVAGAVFKHSGVHNICLLLRDP